ncbi:GapS4a family protein [Vibrio alginolyticus]|uniref:GapS4a family protein n=2 Tax=Vibrionaceae TaxID=641 RepID=UPI0006634B6F|nr:hypothetical protein DET53_11020 [Vibrio parahaemolyticus]CSA25816.1 Uncharacterised protein [Vibrio cholerae]
MRNVMGEFSKYVGEVGEGIVNDFLILFRWKNMCKNKELPCCTPAHNKKTHGIDSLFIYNSPLQKQSLVSVVVSTKYSSKPYDKVSTTFGSHFRDIAHTVECYGKSRLKRDLTKGFKGSSRKDDVGVLFYINNDNSGTKDDIKQDIAKRRIGGDLKFNTIHVIDNARADFLYESLNFINNKYSSYEFFCLTTSLNVAANNQTNHSPIMPVEYITSPIIPLSVSTDSGKKFVMLCDFAFTQESLVLVYKLARKLCAEFANHYEIYFQNYNSLEHDPIRDEVKMSSESEAEIELFVGTYNKSFRSEVNG